MHPLRCCLSADAKGFRDVIGDQFLVGRGFGLLNTVGDHDGRIHIGHASYVLVLVPRVYSMTLLALRPARNEILFPDYG